MSNPRLDALQILLKLLQNKASLTQLLQKEQAPLTKAICFGVCRHYYRLEAIADYLLNKRPKQLDIWLTLLIGLYQLQFLNKPEYAVVQETVAMLDKKQKAWAKGLVNAVLRRFCREKVALLENLEKQTKFIFGHPDWLIKKIKQDWPNDWQSILLNNDTHPPMSLRVNQRHVTRSIYLERLQQVGLPGKSLTYSSVGIALEAPCEVQELPGFANGDIAVQDEAAQLAAPLLALKPGLRILDACAAPGGKTCHILESEPGLKECIALDIDAKRLQRVRENLERMQLKATICQGDVLDLESWWDGILFDRILLDAPCSATGVIRRHPDIKLLRTDAEIQTVVTLQAALLQKLWTVLKPGGLLVYATCSVLQQENTRQIAQFIAQQKDALYSMEKQPWGIATDYGYQLLPGLNNCDGFFYSVLTKVKHDI
ncbi:16S rRNA m5C967 methyltransferase, S-adenosyl-L -methionine-dependent [Legionella beliardensis]|uniref:16S rRNA (cytosine(967)-C(5))-methyltransferase n=1 Tax=Legionella beliardensis TaxID=91822 RepID=A0A378I4P1_9GAMM|nr:16S rRNA (cytosine(967)-C(5))-methyltransferase RsmB [Legionella beliardensis]STX29983.1 16S rRNA m5C967 methyltransferase, S-adenosyl-L -methionine-dependent [Legionella beliardensis]